MFFFLLRIMFDKLDSCRQLQPRMRLVASPTKVSVSFIFKAMLFRQLQLLKFLGHAQLAVESDFPGFELYLKLSEVCLLSIPFVNIGSSQVGGAVSLCLAVVVWHWALGSHRCVPSTSDSLTCHSSLADSPLLILGKC
jgi:hypothetical protein